MVKPFLAAMADDIIGEHGKLGLEIRGKKSWWRGVSLHGGFKHCPDKTRLPRSLIGNSPVARGRLDQRPPVAPFYPRAPVGSEPQLLRCLLACCKSSSPCFSLACFLLLWFASVCGSLSYPAARKKKDSRDSENPSGLLWSGPTRWTPPASWVGRGAECKHGRGKGW